MERNLRLYNTLSRKIEPFRPLKKNQVGLYTCGPTVYQYAHIGNLRTYIFEDLLQRTLEWNGYKVKRVMNITDVGHLTSDADTGEDKVEKEAREERKTPAQIASFYTKAFLADIKKLNIKKPPVLAPATTYIKEQIKIIEALMQKGYAYVTPAAVYFDVRKFRNYGKLSGQSLKEKLTAAREEVVKDEAKRHPADFALWFKREGRFKYHLLHWPSPWGDGFPGWHIECSAISSKFLGQPFDIHTGGVDHIGTHHTNEIAQSEGAYGRQLARFWLHGEFLLVDRAKMAKSENNFFTLSDLLKRGYPALAFRYLTLTAHYRSPLHFSWQTLEQSKTALANLVQKILYLQFRAGKSGARQAKPHPLLREAERQFRDAINSDLNIPQALALTQELLHNERLIGEDAPGLLARIIAFDKVFGLSLGDYLKRYSISRLLTDRKLRALIDEREESRARQQFIQADRLRKKIHALGYVVEDTRWGPFVSPAKL